MCTPRKTRKSWQPASPVGATRKWPMPDIQYKEIIHAFSPTRCPSSLSRLPDLLAGSRHPAHPDDRLTQQTDLKERISRRAVSCFCLWRNHDVNRSKTLGTRISNKPLIRKHQAECPSSFQNQMISEQGCVLSVVNECNGDVTPTIFS